MQITYRLGMVVLSLTCGGLSMAHAQKIISSPAIKAPSTVADARVVDVFGTVQSKRSGRTPFLPLSRGAALPPTTMIRTRENSAVLLRLANGTLLRIGDQSMVTLPAATAGKVSPIKLQAGCVWAQGGGTKPASQLVIDTPSASASAEGGSLLAVSYELEPDLSTVSVQKGKAVVSLASGGWSDMAAAGQFVRYLRRPQPNIRLRKPQVEALDDGQQVMWRLLLAESWTKGSGKSGALQRGNEEKLRNYLRSRRMNTDDNPTGAQTL